jgi:deoxyribonuclease V
MTWADSAPVAKSMPVGEAREIGMASMDERLEAVRIEGLTPREAVAAQREMAGQRDPAPPRAFEPRLVAGADVSAARRSRRGHAAVVVLDADTLEVREAATAEAELSFPYVPGLLSFRELPPLLAAWRRLEATPDVVIFDGHGTAHPRRFGLACHGGLLLDVPSIGCGKSLLVGEHGPLGEERGSTAELVHRGEVVGAAVRTRTGVRPVYVSPGHRMDLETAVRTVLAVAPRYREPETTRAAHRLVNRLRRAAVGGA